MTRALSVLGALIVAPSLWLSAASPGPIAIGMTNANSAIVLQSDGRLIAFDTTSNDAGKQLYQVPAGFQAADVAAAPFGRGSITCFSLNAKPTKAPARRGVPANASFVLQLTPDRGEVWTHLPARGVYVGVAIDAAARYAYTANSTNNGIYRLVLGDEKAPVVEVARILEAERVGALALDAANARLFVADMGTGRVFVVPLASRARVRAITLPGVEEIRALAWSPLARKVFVADAAQEAVWSVDPERPDNPARIKDSRLREPAGLTTTRDGHVWLVDEGAHAVFQLSPVNNTVLRAVRFK